jgi:cytochrome c biogenesis protein ResB
MLGGFVENIAVILFLTVCVIGFALGYAATLWRDVRMEDARSRMRCADIEAERHRAPLQAEIDARVAAAVVAALAAHRSELDSLSQDIADQRSRASWKG